MIILYEAPSVGRLRLRFLGTGFIFSARRPSSTLPSPAVCCFFDLSRRCPTRCPRPSSSFGFFFSSAALLGGGLLRLSALGAALLVRGLRVFHCLAVLVGRVLLLVLGVDGLDVGDPGGRHACLSGFFSLVLTGQLFLLRPERTFARPPRPTPRRTPGR